MVVVEGRAFFEPQVVPVTVIAIVLEDGDLVVADAADDPARSIASFMVCLPRLLGAGPADIQTIRCAA